MKPIRPHPDHHDLHGVTIAVDTAGPLYVGRCHTIDEIAVRLVDVDVHEGPDKRAFLDRVARFGHWKKHDRLSVPLDQVAWLQTLGEIAANGPPPQCP